MGEFRFQGRFLRRRWQLWLVPLLLVVLLAVPLVKKSVSIQKTNHAALVKELSFSVTATTIKDLKQTIKADPGESITQNAKDSLKAARQLQKAAAQNDTWAYTLALAKYRKLGGSADPVLDALVKRHIPMVSFYAPHKPALNALPRPKPLWLLVVLAFGIADALSALTPRQEDLIALVPRAKIGIFWRRLAWSFIWTFGSFLAANAIVFAYLAARGGVGHLNYPVASRITGTYPLWQELAAYLAMIAAWTALLCAVAGLVRCLTAKFTSVLAVLLAVLLLSQTTVFQSVNFPHLALYWLPNYVDIGTPIDLTLSVTPLEAAEWGSVLLPLPQALVLMLGAAAALGGAATLLVSRRRWR
ncbi:hypothetical protein [Lacticaseibacillus suihuaensis]